MSHHGVDISRRYKEGVFWLAELCEVTVAAPVGLRNYSHGKAQVFYYSGDYGNSE